MLLIDVNQNIKLMALERLEEQTNHFRYYVLDDGRVVNIVINEEGTEIGVSTVSGETIGRFEFQALHELDDDLQNSSLPDDSYKLMWMGLEDSDEDYQRAGIGTQCLAIHKELFNAPIYVSPPGHNNGDGSELVHHGPAFAEAMKRIGLIDGYIGEALDADEY